MMVFGGGGDGDGASRLCGDDDDAGGMEEWEDFFPFLDGLQTYDTTKSCCCKGQSDTGVCIVYLLHVILCLSVRRRGWDGKCAGYLAM